MADDIYKSSDINLKIFLDKSHIPQKISWNASDKGGDNPRDCKAFMLSLWDEKDLNTLRIDLWTKEMRVDEMDQFFYQTIMTMADTYLRATNNQKGANDMRAFGKTFAEKAGLTKAG